MCRFYFLFLFTSSLLALLFCNCSSEKTPQLTKQIPAIDPPKPSPIKVLIVDGFSNHNWQQTTLLIKEILLESNLFTVAVSTAPETQDSPNWDSWRPPFDEYDVVIQTCNSYGNRPTWPQEVKQQLENFVANGGGLYVFHSANNAFPQWQEYNKMIGLGWRNKDFGKAIVIEEQEAITKIPAGEGGNTSHGPRIDALLTRLGEHPIHQDLPKQWLAADLEVYSYARGPAENLTVLSYCKEPVTGLQFPTEWVVNYGKGRVYSSTYGHVWHEDGYPPGMRCVAFQTIFIRALEWLSNREITVTKPANFPTTESIQLIEIPTANTTPSYANEESLCVLPQ